MASFTLKQPKNRELLGGDLLAQSLAQLGVKVAFGLHGGHLDAFLVGCYDAGIDLVDTRHETVAVQAAEGYAKVTGTTGVCFVTANSGFCNGLPGLATAFADRSPIFCITSSPPLRDAETNCLQGFHDQVVLAKPVTKFCHRVTKVEEIPRLTAYAFHTATAAGAPGPVLIDFPIDVLFSPPRQSAIAWGAITRPAALAPSPDPKAISTLLDLWHSASRPVIITGTGAHHTSTDLLNLASQLSTPIFYSSKYSSAIPHDHPLRGGPAGLLAVLPYLQKPQPDLVILLGARTGFLLGGRSGAIIPNPPTAKTVQIDLDGGEIGRSHPIDLGIVSDAGNFLSATLAALKSHNHASSDRSEWLTTCASLKSLPSPHANSPHDMPDGRMHPYHALRTLFESLPRNSIVTMDGGESGVWALDVLETAQPQLGMASTGYLGFLGNGWGYSLGAAVASGGQSLVVNVQGDGSAGFHIAELDTFSRHGLRILTVVVDNAVWGMSLAGQDLVYGSRSSHRPASRLNPGVRYDVVAHGFGCPAVRVEKIDHIPDAVKTLTDGGHGPGLIDLIVSDRPITQVTRAMVNMTDNPDMIVVPYYDNIPRTYTREELKAEMNGKV